MSLITPLRGKKDFDQLFSARQYRCVTEHFVLLSNTNDYAEPRMGTILAKKKIRLAVTRNLIKRHLREFLRAHPVSCDYLIIARKKLGSHEKKKLSEKFNSYSKQCNTSKAA